MTRRISVVLLVSLAPPVVWSSDTSSQQPRFREDIVVTADRADEPREELTASVSVVTRREIERLPARTLAEVLDVVPGLTIDFADGNAAKPIVASRGFFGGGEVEYVRLLVDGVPVGDPESGLVDWRSIPASDIDRIEVLRGPGSSLYGDAAVGGVVQVFTRYATKKASGEFSLDGGNDGKLGGEASYRPLLRGLETSVRGSVSHEDGWRAHSATDLKNAALSVGTRGTKGGWAIRLSGEDLDRDDPGPLPLVIAKVDASLSEALYRFDNEKTTRLRASARRDRRVGRFAFQSALHLEERWTDILRSLLLAPALGDSAFRKLRSITGGATFIAEGNWMLLGRSAQTRAAIDYDGASIDSDYFAVMSDGAIGSQTAGIDTRRDRLGFYVGQDWHLTSATRISASLRRDWVRDSSADRSDDRGAWSPRVGLSASLGRGAHAHVQFSSAFRAPTVDQLFDARGFPDFRGGTFTISNASLAPERAQTVEAGFAGTARSYRWDVVAYESKVTDEIDFDPATFRYRNIGRSRHRGIEVAGSAEIRGVQTALSYDWTRVESLTDATQAQLKNIPEHVLRASVSTTFPLSIGTTLIYTLKAGRHLDDGALFPLGATHVLNAKLYRRFDRFRVEVHVFNLLNQKANAIGFVLTDFRGTPVPYVYPAERLTARVVAGWTF